MGLGGGLGAGVLAEFGYRVSFMGYRVQWAVVEVEMPTSRRCSWGLETYSPIWRPVTYLFLIGCTVVFVSLGAANDLGDEDMGEGEGVGGERDDVGREACTHHSWPIFCL